MKINTRILFIDEFHRKYFMNYSSIFLFCFLIFTITPFLSQLAMGDDESYAEDSGDGGGGYADYSGGGETTDYSGGGETTDYSGTFTDLPAETTTGTFTDLPAETTTGTFTDLPAETTTGTFTELGIQSPGGSLASDQGLVTPQQPLLPQEGELIQPAAQTELGTNDIFSSTAGLLPPVSQQQLVEVLPPDVQQQLSTHIQGIGQQFLESEAQVQGQQIISPFLAELPAPDPSIFNFGGTGMSINELARGFNFGGRIISPTADPFARNINQQVLNTNIANLDPSISEPQKTQNLLNIVPKILQDIPQIVPNIQGKQVVLLRDPEVRAQRILNFAFPEAKLALESKKSTLPLRSQEILERAEVSDSQLLSTILPKTVTGTPTQILNSAMSGTPLVLSPIEPPIQPFTVANQIDSPTKASQTTKSRLLTKTDLCTGRDGRFEVRVIIPLAGC
jgi:hypothetical protein